MHSAPLLDHLVWGAPNLETGVVQMSELFGTSLVQGGCHPGVGTRNALLGLQNGQYFEVLAPDPEQSSYSGFGRWIEPLDHACLVTWAGRTEDLDTLASHARDGGLDPSEIASMARRKPDGTQLRWRLMTVGGHRFERLVPFFIEWAEGHPCDQLEAAASLEVLELTTPEPEGLQRILETLGLTREPISVVKAAQPSLRANLRTAQGEHVSVAS